METKVDVKKMETIRRKLDFVYGIDVEVDGSKGHFYLAWRGDVQVTLHHFSQNFIDVLIKPSVKDVEWRFIGFYGSPYASNRSSTWKSLRRLGCNNRIPWFVCEDFKEILYTPEKF